MWWWLISPFYHNNNNNNNHCRAPYAKLQRRCLVPRLSIGVNGCCLFTPARRYCNPSCSFVGLCVRLFVNIMIGVNVSKTVGDRDSRVLIAEVKNTVFSGRYRGQGSRVPLKLVGCPTNFVANLEMWKEGRGTFHTSDVHFLKALKHYLHLKLLE